MYISNYISRIWRRFRIEILILIFSLLCIGVSGYYIYVSLHIPQQTTVKAVTNPPFKAITSINITIEVSGAVMNPGVYVLEKDSRIIDALEMAGGLNGYAAKDFIARNFNLTLPMEDMQKIHVPSYSEIYEGIFREQERYLSYLTTQTVEDNPVVNTAQEQQSKVNINDGTVSQLDQLPGVGPKTAEKIVENRPFLEKEDLLEKKVISESVLKQIENLISY